MKRLCVFIFGNATDFCLILLAGWGGLKEKFTQKIKIQSLSTCRSDRKVWWSFKKTPQNISGASQHNHVHWSRPGLVLRWFFYFLKRVPVHVSCSGESCDAVLLWSSWNVLLTSTKLHPNGGEKVTLLIFSNLGWISPLNKQKAVRCSCAEDSRPT